MFILINWSDNDDIDRKNQELCDPYVAIAGNGEIAICKTPEGPIIRGEVK
jgi:hypothetical protein